MTLRTQALASDGPPCHLVAAAGDRRSICGVKDPLPHVLARFAGQEHYDRLYCPECVKGSST